MSKFFFSIIQPKVLCRKIFLLQQSLKNRDKCSVDILTGLKADEDVNAFSVVSMILSGFFLFLAQRHIPIGTAYAVWTGIGAVGTFIVGVFLFKDPMMVSRLLGISLIIAGVMILKFTAV